ncbi:tRNA ligase subunit PheS family protein, partial [Staphylococcus simulans]
MNGYEVEQDYDKFEELNLTKAHPARDRTKKFDKTEEKYKRKQKTRVQERKLEKGNDQRQGKIHCPEK